jgi:CRP-like cAMP-binding protein
MLSITPRPEALFLSRQEWFADLPPRQQSRTLASAITISGRRGDTLLRAGAQSEGWYAVLDGLVKMQMRTMSGRFAHYVGMQGGEWFGEGSALKHELRRYEIVALRETTLVCLPNALFDDLVASSLAFNHALLASLNARLGQAITFMGTSRMLSSIQVLAGFLCRPYWMNFPQTQLHRDELALITGVSRDRLDRLLEQLIERDLVRLNGEVIEVPDEASIREFINNGLGDY